MTNRVITADVLRTATKIHDVQCVSALPVISEFPETYPGEHQAVCACGWASPLATKPMVTTAWIAHVVD